MLENTKLGIGIRLNLIQHKRKEQTMIFALTKEFIQNHETSWVVINSKNTHTERKTVNDPIFIPQIAPFVLHNHLQRRTKTVQRSRFKVNKDSILEQELNQEIKG